MSVLGKETFFDLGLILDLLFSGNVVFYER